MTRDAWLVLEVQFLRNQETRALHLDVKFRHFSPCDDLSSRITAGASRTWQTSLATLARPLVTARWCSKSFMTRFEAVATCDWPRTSPYFWRSALP
jgi:hypothetical protein